MKTYQELEQILKEHPITDDEYEEFWDTHDRDDWTCDCCGGEGIVEYMDVPEVWGEDCPSEENHLVNCPHCWELERDIKWAIVEKRLKNLTSPSPLYWYGK